MNRSTDEPINPIRWALAAVAAAALAGCSPTIPPRAVVAESPAVAPGAVAAGAVAPGAVQVASGATIQPGGVRGRMAVEAPIRASLDAPVAFLSPTLHVHMPAPAAAVPASQPASAAASATAGRDAIANPVVVNVSGSAWPLVAVAALVVGGGAALSFAALHGLSSSRLKRLRDNAVAVARAVALLGPGRQRDGLLADVERLLPDRASWDRLLDVHRLRVRRRQEIHPPGGGSNVAASTPQKQGVNAA